MERFLLMKDQLEVSEVLFREMAANLPEGHVTGFEPDAEE